jgi:hypothetical protein
VPDKTYLTEVNEFSKVQAKRILNPQRALKQKILVFSILLFRVAAVE